MLQGSCLCGQLQWTMQQMPESATACNCTACRRYGSLWAYGHEGVDITVSGPATPYVRGKALSFNFCPRCGNVAYWRGAQTDEQGQRRIAVNLRLAEPGPIAGLPIDHFDGLDTWDDLPRDGRCIRDLWF